MTSEATNIWSTKRMDSLLKEFDKTGVLPRENPFFMRKTDKKKADLVWEYTYEELLDIATCKHNILAFARKCKVMTKKGLDNIKLRPYQIVVLKKLKENNFFIYLASRQIGKSIIIGIFISWITTFFSDKACLLGSENLYKAKDLKSKIDVIIHNLPFYMQNGVVYFSTQRTIFDNGSKIVSEPTTENFGVSGSYNVVYMDEFALLEDHMQNEIIKHTLPTLDSFGDEARLIISTTPRGKNNKFYSLWSDSLEKRNKFGNFMTKWYEVDGRDDKWRKEQIAIMGLEGFNQEYDLSFQADSKLLFNSETQKELDKAVVEYNDHKEISRLIIDNHIIPSRKDNIYEKTKKKNDFEIPNELLDLEISKIFSVEDSTDSIYEGVVNIKSGYKLKKFKDESRQFLTSIDLAEGVGKDYSVINIFEITPLKKSEIKNLTTIIDESSFFRLEQVAVIRSNELSVEDFAKFTYYFFTLFCNYQNYRIILENNYEGGLYMKTLFELNGENNQLDPSEMMVDFPWNMEQEDAQTFKTGIKQTNKTKEKGAKNVIRHYKNKRILINEKKTILEGQGFGRNKKGNYEGSTRNDDNFMTVVNASHYFDSDYFYDQVEEIMEELDEEISLLIYSAIQENDNDPIDDFDYSDFDVFGDN